MLVHAHAPALTATVVAIVQILQPHLNLFGCHITFGQRSRSLRAGGLDAAAADGAAMDAPPLDESALQRVDDFRSRHRDGLGTYATDKFGRLLSADPVGIALDAQQAWFTVNALYFCINTGVVHDPTQRVRAACCQLYVVTRLSLCLTTRALVCPAVCPAVSLPTQGLKDLRDRVLRHIPQPDGRLVSKSPHWPLEVVCSATELGFSVAPETWEVRGCCLAVLPCPCAHVLTGVMPASA